MTKAGLPEFLLELFARFPLKSPKFFQYFQLAGIIATCIGFIPDALVFLEITPTEIFSHYLEIVLKVAGIVTWIMAKLPVENATKTALTTDKMPFTASVKNEENTLKKVA